jgi:hypothetical protein
LTEGELVLVVGSYPPVPTPGSEASMAAVRRAWAGGCEVTVVSPRPSAAHLTVAVVGVLAGHRLTALRHLTGARAVVLVAEAGLPVPSGPKLVQEVTVRGVVRALGGFDRATVVRAGPLRIPSRLEARLLAGAAEVIDEPVRSGPDPGVTVLGPQEVSLRERPRWMAERLARAVLARLPDGPRDRVLVTVRRVRAATARHAG